MKRDKRNYTDINKFPSKMGIEKLNELSSMLDGVGVANKSATNKKTKEYGILLVCDCCQEVYCIKAYKYEELMILNNKEEIYNLIANI